MLKRINWRAVVYGFIWLLSLSGLIIVMSFIGVKKSGLRCIDVKVVIPGTQSFIERAEVDRIILNNQGPLIGRMLDKINIQLLEKTLKANPFIEDASVFGDMDGVINVQIRQREPLVRILNFTNQDFYIDRKGIKIPVSVNFTAQVLVASGFIMEDFSNRVDTLKTKLARDLYAAALFIEQDSLWNDQIEQLYVNRQGEIEMVPRVGNQRIILGNADSLQVKFRNLKAFYKTAMPKAGWDAYKTINIKYAGQVVCEKNITDSSAVHAMAVTDSDKIISDIIKSIKHPQDTSKISIH